MFRHVVMFKWNDDVDDAHVQAVTDGLNSLPAAIAQIVDYRHGRDVGVSGGNYDYVVVADFESQDDFVVYRDHPVHQRVVKDSIAGRIAERAAVQVDLAD